MNSDEIVDRLQPYGSVRIFQHDNGGFRAKAELFMHGVSAEVVSDFKHPTMRSALIQLHDRVMDVVAAPVEKVQQDCSSGGECKYHCVGDNCVLRQEGDHGDPRLVNGIIGEPQQ